MFVSNVFGLFEFKLVHNTGAAWGVLSNSTFVLGVFSCIVCVIIALYVFALRKGRMHAVECLGLSLVFSVDWATLSTVSRKVTWLISSTRRS